MKVTISPVLAEVYHVYTNEYMSFWLCMYVYLYARACCTCKMEIKILVFVITIFTLNISNTFRSVNIF